MSQTFHLLLVEDNKAEQRLTQEALQMVKVKTKLHIAGDGEEAMDFLKKRGKHIAAERPDLILLDSTLPYKSGEEVLREIGEDPSLRKIPVVVLTGRQDPEFLKTIMALEADCHVTKPINVEEHFEVVKTIVNYWFNVCGRS